MHSSFVHGDTFLHLNIAATEFCFFFFFTSNSMQNGFRSAGVPLLAPWTGKDIGRSLSFNKLDYLQRDD